MLLIIIAFVSFLFTCIKQEHLTQLKYSIDMKYYIIAGEVSGDPLHASFLMKEIKLQDPEAEFRVWGGGQYGK